MWPQPRSRSAGAPGERSCTTQGVACVWEAARVVLAAARAEVRLSRYLVRAYLVSVLQTFLKRMGPISSFSSVDTAAPSCFSSAARRVQLAAMKNAPVPILSAKRVERVRGIRYTIAPGRIQGAEMAWVSRETRDGPSYPRLGRGREECPYVVGASRNWMQEWDGRAGVRDAPLEC
ncbi:hypothetical protein B0H14DRAFT_776262 [Mycena olivaceomarginata]|nr:hypothetical protein B0H14DRAFT_776262 [Mycena olivaceomarginata]